MAIQFSTRSVAPDDRFDYWIDSSRKAFYPTTFHSVDNRTRFTGTLKQFLLGPLSITRVTSAATKVERTQADLAAYDPDLIHLSLQLGGCSTFGQDGRSSPVGAGQMVLLDVSRPFTIHTDDPYDVIVVECARSMLGSVGDGSLVTARTLGGDLVRTLVTPFVHRVANGLGSGTISENDTDLGNSVLYLLRALCADANPAEPSEGKSPATLLLRARVYIDQHLHEADLRPEKVAAAHFISIRYLQKLFQAEGVTVTDWIRERRLACCRRDLRDPSMAHLTILAIASRWGLTNPAYFSRAFRARYGCSPRDYRFMGSAGPEEPRTAWLPRVP